MPSNAAAFSMPLNLEINFSHAFINACSGSTPTCLEKFTSVNKISPNSSSIASLEVAARNSYISSSSFSSTSISFCQSNPTLDAYLLTICANSNADIFFGKLFNNNFLCFVYFHLAIDHIT